jgi:hypothetical protein
MGLFSLFWFEARARPTLLPRWRDLAALGSLRDGT